MSKMLVSAVTITSVMMVQTIAAAPNQLVDAEAHHTSPPKVSGVTFNIIRTFYNNF